MMAPYSSIKVAPFALLLVVMIALQQLPTSTGDFLSPLLAPIFENVCKEVGCGKGKCQPSQKGGFPFECVCEDGWKQPVSSEIEHDFKFLPCVIPNCSIDYSCSSAPPSPAVSRRNATHGMSIFDPCSWDFCGAGTCKNSSSFSSSSYSWSSSSSSSSSSNSSSYSCSCKEGYSNLFNSTSFPCFKQCSLGGDCQRLGITMFNSSNTSGSPAARSPSALNVVNEGISVHNGKFHYIFVLMALMISIVLGV